MKIVKNSIILSAVLSLNLNAEPAAEAEEKKPIENTANHVITIQESFSKVTGILNSAFVAMAEVKDEETLAILSTKLDDLAKEMLALDGELDETKEASDEDMKVIAAGFVSLSDKVAKQMQAVGKSKLSEEISNKRDMQFMKFMQTVTPIRQKTEAICPPQKLSKYVKEIKAKQAENAKKK